MNTQIKHTFLDYNLLPNCHTVVFVSPEFKSRGFLASSFPKITSTVLSPYSNGVEQIARVLAHSAQVRTVHICAAGEPGKLILGNVHLTIDNIEQYAWDIQDWFGFTPSFIQPSLVLDGCSVGDGREGTELIHWLRHLTGSHITCRQSSTQRHLQLV